MAKKKKRSKKDDSKLFAFIAVLLSIIGFIIAVLAKRKDKYVMYYAKQSLVLFIFAVIVSIIGGIFYFIPVTGEIVKTLLDVVVFIFWIIQIVNSLSGKMKETPIIGQYAEKIKI